MDFAGSPPVEMPRQCITCSSLFLAFILRHCWDIKGFHYDGVGNSIFLTLHSRLVFLSLPLFLLCNISDKFFGCATCFLEVVIGSSRILVKLFVILLSPLISFHFNLSLLSSQCLAALVLLSQPKFKSH